MKIVFHEKMVVINVIENIKDLKIVNNNIYFAGGSLEGLNESIDFHIFNDDVEIKELNDTILKSALDKKQFVPNIENPQEVINKLTRQIAQLQETNASLMLISVEKDLRISKIEETLADVIQTLSIKDTKEGAV